jgi:hypothetical protein
MSKTELGLYTALENELKKSTEPLDSATLFERATIREHAQTVNRVSDYLGNMWRKGEVVRLPAPRHETNRSRWMYMWKGRRPAPPPTMDQAVVFADKKMLLQRPSIEISESGDTVTIELPNWVLTIKSR